MQSSKTSHSPSFTNTHKKFTCRTICTEHLLNAGEDFKPPKWARNPPHNWVEQKGKKKSKGIRTGPIFLRGSC